MDWLTSNLLKLLGVLGLVLVNGFFVAAELSLVRIRETQVEPLAKQGNWRAKIVRRLIQNLDTTISAIQFGITLANLGVGVLLEPVFEAVLTPLFNGLGVQSEAVRHLSSIVTGFVVSCFLLTVVGELLPKAIAIRRTLRVALWTAVPLSWFARVASPFVWLLHHSAQWLLRKTGIQPASEAERGHSPEELRLLVSIAQQRAGAARVGRDIVLNALDLKGRIVREVMRPRQEIIGLDTDADIAECLGVAERTRYSRFPLCEGGNLDRTPGVVHIKDLYAVRHKAANGAALAAVARKLIYVPETTRLEKLLQLFLDRKLHFALVVDEYGGTVGMVTLENVLEELVGQIQDEFDQEKPLFVKTSTRTWELAGTLPLHELAMLVQEPLAGEGITTVNGWVTQRLGGFPKEGDSLPLARGAYELRVEETEGLRVAKLKLTRLIDDDARPAGG
jgi:CBS domain containing-hemolysin-like protein